MATVIELAGLAWAPLVAAAQRRHKPTYEELAQSIGTRGVSLMGQVLEPLQRYCLEKSLPPLTSIVINKRTGLPGKGFTAVSGDPEDAQEATFTWDWRGITPPFQRGRFLARPSGFRPGSLRTTVADYAVDDIEAVVNGRGVYQSRFRHALMMAYGRRCALCTTSHPGMLVGSHIVPWSVDRKNRLNPSNGILFCRTHDGLFELGLVRVRPDLKVEIVGVSQKSCGTELSTFAKHRTGHRLRAPSGTNRPDPDFLEWRYRHAADICSV